MSLNPNASSYVPAWFGWGNRVQPNPAPEPMETTPHVHSLQQLPVVEQTEPVSVPAPAPIRKPEPVITTTGSEERNDLMLRLQAWLTSAPAWVKDEPIVNWEEVAKCDLNEEFIMTHILQLTPVTHVLALHVRLTEKILKAFESKWNWQSLLKNKTLTNELLKPYYKQMDANWLLPSRKVPGDVILDNLQSWPLDLIFKTQKIDTETAIIMMQRAEETGRAALLYQLLNNNRMDERFFQAVTQINPSLLSVEQLIRGVKLGAQTLDGLCRRAANINEQRRIILQILQDQRPVPQDWMTAWAFQDWILQTPQNVCTLLAAGPLPTHIITQIMSMIMSQTRLVLVYVANQKVSLVTVKQLAQITPGEIATQVYLSALQNALNPANNWDNTDIRDLAKEIDRPINIYRTLKDDESRQNMVRVFPELATDPDTVSHRSVKALGDNWHEMTVVQKAIAITLTRKAVEAEGENRSWTPSVPLSDVAKYWWRITTDEDGLQHVAAASTKCEAYKLAFDALTKEEWRQVLLASDPKNYLKPWVIDTIVACGYNRTLSDGVDFWWKIAKYQPLTVTEFRKYVQQGVVNPDTVAQNQINRWNNSEIEAWINDFGAFMDEATVAQLKSAMQHKM